MKKQQKKIYTILSIFLALVFTTKAFASLTFTNNAITGTTASTIDLGSGHDLYLQTSGGNVGIGTTTPGKTLDVNGTINSSGTVVLGTTGSGTSLTIKGATGPSTAVTFSSPLLQIGGAGQYDGTMAFPGVSGVQTIVNINATNLYGGTNQGAGLTFGSDKVNDSRIVYLSDFGNGVSSELQLQAHTVNSNVYTPGIILWGDGEVTVGNDTARSSYRAPLTSKAMFSVWAQSGSIYTPTAFQIIGTNGTTVLDTIDNSGNLGIGTTSPGAKIEIKDGHYSSTQTTAPTASVTGTGYSGASMGSGSTDTKGLIIATVGANAGTLVVTFNSAYNTAPVCTVTPTTATAQVDHNKMYATFSTTALTINFAASPTGGSETWSYICLQ